MMLESLQNPRLKAVRALHARKGRQAAGHFLLETTKLLQEASAAAWPLVEVFATAPWLERYGAPAGIPCTEVAEKIFGALVTTETPEGVVAVARLPGDRPLPAAPDAWYLLVEALQDPGNLGTLIRTADAVGLAAVLLGTGTTDAYAPKVVRGSMGGVLHLPVLERRDLHADIRTLQARGVRVLAAAHGGASLYAQDLRGPVAWLVGNEGAGLAEATLALADAVVSIPMPGRAESLNAAMAGAVLLYETLRQRLG